MNKMYKPEDYRDFAHTGPQTLAGKFLRSFWTFVLRALGSPFSEATMSCCGIGGRRACRLAAL